MPTHQKLNALTNTPKARKSGLATHPTHKPPTMPANTSKARKSGEPPTTGIVLGGGLSTRFAQSSQTNQSKLLIHLGGKLVLSRVADTLKMVCSELVLVVRPDQADDVPDLGIALNMHVVADTAPYEGPLAGIHAGLAASTTPLSFVIAGDHPFVSRRLVSAMAAAAAVDGPDSLSAVVPRSGGTLNPLHAIYPREHWLPYFAHAMSEGDKSPRYVIEQAIAADYPPVTVFTDDDIEKVDPRKLSLMNINTQANLNEARKVLDSRRFTPRHHSLG